MPHLLVTVPATVALALQCLRNDTHGKSLMNNRNSVVKTPKPPRQMATSIDVGR